jgi:hypothetical protein
MVKTIALIGFVAALAVPQASFAGSPTGYGTEGPYGKTLHNQARSTPQRHWNAWNESKHRAEASASWMREHGKSFPTPF